MYQASGRKHAWDITLAFKKLSVQGESGSGATRLAAFRLPPPSPSSATWAEVTSVPQSLTCTVGDGESSRLGRLL